MDDNTTRREKLQVFRSIIQEDPDITQPAYDTLKVPGKPTRAWLKRLGFETWESARQFAIVGDIDLILENVRLAKQRQKFMDSNRIERKAFREHARIENALEELTGEMVALLKEQSFRNNIQYHEYTPSVNGAAGILQISDTHFNELIELKNNTYDFTVASTRMRKYANRARQYFNAFGVRNLLVVMTGDILNSDRRLDEKLNMATNRTKAMFLATKIITQFLLDLNLDFNITVAAVSGNESRVMEEPGVSDMVITDNYDYSIFMLLKMLMDGADGIQFYEAKNFASYPICVAGKWFLILHGCNGSISKNVETSVQQLIGMWSAKGYHIDYVIFGHLHSARIGDNYARSSSLCGSNTYNEESLNLIGRASQNVYIVHSDGSIDGTKVDLQDVAGWTGYPIETELASYNAKSASKLHQNKTIFEVTI